MSREAANLRKFNYNFRKTRHVYFPVPLYPLVNPDVLVETFETGKHITSYIQSDTSPYNHRRDAQPGQWSHSLDTRWSTGRPLISASARAALPSQHLSSTARVLA